MNSLTKRLDTIEEILHDTQQNDIVSKLKRLEEIKKKERIDAMNNSYKEYLNDSLINSVNPILGSSDFINVLICTIKYVRLNNHNISRTLGVKPSIELESECITHFIQSIYGDTFEDEFIRTSALSLERLIYPINKPVISDEEEKPEKKKGWFGTIKNKS